MARAWRDLGALGDRQRVLLIITDTSVLSSPHRGPTRLSLREDSTIIFFIIFSWCIRSIFPSHGSSPLGNDQSHLPPLESNQIILKGTETCYRWTFWFFIFLWFLVCEAVTIRETSVTFDLACGEALQGARTLCLGEDRPRQRFGEHASLARSCRALSCIDLNAHWGDVYWIFTPCSSSPSSEWSTIIRRSSFRVLRPPRFSWCDAAFSSWATCFSSSHFDFFH